jgi:hypothetical protein
MAQADIGLDEVVVAPPTEITHEIEVRLVVGSATWLV